MFVKNLVKSITEEQLSKFEVVRLIDSNTNDANRELFLEELFDEYGSICGDLVLSLREQEIIEIIEKNVSEAHYIHLGKKAMLFVKHLTRMINGQLVVYNIRGFIFGEKPGPDTVKILLLNDLIVDHFTGVFTKEKEGFEGLYHFREICRFLKAHYKSKNYFTANYYLDEQAEDISFENEEFNTIIADKKKQAYILKMLEDLSITVNGKSALTARKKGMLRGVVEALIYKSIVPSVGLHNLCKIFATKIQLELKSELDASDTSEKAKKSAIEYIENHPFH